VGQKRLACLIRQIAEVTLRNRRLEGAVVTDQRPFVPACSDIDCVLIVKHADTPEQLAESENAVRS